MSFMPSGKRAGWLRRRRGLRSYSLAGDTSPGASWAKVSCWVLFYSKYNEKLLDKLQQRGEPWSDSHCLKIHLTSLRGKGYLWVSVEAGRSGRRWLQWSKKKPEVAGLGKKHLEKWPVGRLARFLGESHQDLLMDLIDVWEEKVRNREMGWYLERTRDLGTISKGRGCWGGVHRVNTADQIQAGSPCPLITRKV